VLKVASATIAEVRAWRNYSLNRPLYDLDGLGFQVMPLVSKLANEYAVSRHAQWDEHGVALVKGQTVPARNNSLDVHKEGNFQDASGPS
jgi:hypothetical protein